MIAAENFKIVYTNNKGLSKITFVELNRFCPLSKKRTTSLFLMDNVKLDGISSKIK